jgi:hypothetical protein
MNNKLSLPFDDEGNQYAMITGTYTLKLDLNDLPLFYNYGFELGQFDNPPISKICRNTYLCDLLYGVNYNDPLTTLVHKDGDKYNYRRNNCCLMNSFEEQLKKKYNIIKHIPGHRPTMGKDAKITKNHIWVTDDNMYIIHCEPDEAVIIDKAGYDKIILFENMNGIKLTWFITFNGYVGTKLPSGIKFCGVTGQITLHQFLMNFVGKGKGTANLSIDHINRDKLDNRMSNLRIVDCKTQHSNAKGIIPGTKRSRKQNAQTLPEGITEDMMPKYVVYYSEIYNKETGATREFFRVEKHPNQTKDISTSKSNKINILQKLEEAKQIIYKLENNEGNDTLSLKSNEIEPGFSLPKYFCRALQHGKNALSFDRKLTDGRRINIKITMKDGETYKNAVERLTMNIKQKYNEDEIETILN